MNILDKIIADKVIELSRLKAHQPAKALEQSTYFNRVCISLKERLLEPVASGIIAEVKRQSPSQGTLHKHVEAMNLAAGYARAGATALSILTDYKYFGGTNEDLLNARKVVDCPILRKEFIIDEYQLLEAKSIGADVILLIAAALKPDKIKQLTKFAHSLGLEVLLEVHDEVELKSNLDSEADLIGVNNRNLKTFNVSLAASLRLLPMIPATVPKISESGIDSAEAVRTLKGAGYQGFLVGQNFMRHQHPEQACDAFIKSLRV